MDFIISILSELPYLSMVAKMQTESLLAIAVLVTLAFALVKLEFSKV